MTTLRWPFYIVLLYLLQAALAAPWGLLRSATVSKTDSPITPSLKASFPKLTGADAPPIGAYICNANRIYQATYVTSTVVDWVLLDTCDTGMVCQITMGNSGNYVGCIAAPR
ncbi:hypothetical protein BDR26DRAFT_864476 [Obelidium mucronatum]|nr:hypothetical protein BDR26DRAFT_864476 [Obelidium mucronatum]